MYLGELLSNEHPVKVSLRTAILGLVASASLTVRPNVLDDASRPIVAFSRFPQDPGLTASSV